MLTLDEYSVKVGISVEELNSRRRFAEIVTARQVWWFYLRDNGYGLSEIGRMYSMDHATVWHGVKRIRDLIWVEDGYLDRYLGAIGYLDSITF